MNKMQWTFLYIPTAGTLPPARYVQVEGAHDGDQSLLPLSGTPDRALHRKLAVVQEALAKALKKKINK